MRHYIGILITTLLLAHSQSTIAHEQHNQALNVQTTVAVKGVKSASNSRWGEDYFPNITLVNHEGKSVRFYDDLIKDKVVVINFMYASCPDACPMGTARLAKVQRILGDRVGRDIFMYSITIDPTRDTPKVLKAYAKKFNAGPGWSFLTGNESDILLLRKKLGLYMSGLDEELKDHNMSFLIGNQRTGQWMKRSPMDNPYFIAEQIGTWLTNWRTPSSISNNNYAQAPEFKVPDMGENLFRTRCTACHTIGIDSMRIVGGGKNINMDHHSTGPDLLHIVQKRDPVWLARWLKNPGKMLAEKDTIAEQLYAEWGEVLMPNLRLNQVEIDALINYLSEESLRVERQRSSRKQKSNRPEVK